MQRHRAQKALNAGSISNAEVLIRQRVSTPSIGKQIAVPLPAVVNPDKAADRAEKDGRRDTDKAADPPADGAANRRDDHDKKTSHGDDSGLNY